MKNKIKSDFTDTVGQEQAAADAAKESSAKETASGSKETASGSKEGQIKKSKLKISILFFSISIIFNQLRFKLLTISIWFKQFDKSQILCNSYIL